MNENENKSIGEGEPRRDEDTKAFNWQWTDGEGKTEQGQPEGGEGGEGEEVKPEETMSEETMPEQPKSDNSADEESETESTRSEAEYCQETQKEKQPKEESPKDETKKKKSRAPAVASILSACSIVLLLSFALSLMLGIFPVKGRDVVLVGVSDSGKTDADVNASPELIEKFINSVVVVTAKTGTGTSTGTGVILSNNGYIITNYHVIEGSDNVTVQLRNEDIAQKAEIVGFHEKDDVAVIKVNRTDLQAATFARSSDVRYGEKIYAVGTPEGTEFRWSVTQGIVSCPSRELLEYNGDGTLAYKINVVQIDASVNHGNSGGPIFNVRGEVVGIVTLKKIWSQQSNSSGNREPVEGMGFALPSSGVLIDATAIIEQGNADNVDSGIILPRPLLGVTGVGVQEKTYYESYTDESGSGVKAVEEEYAKANPNTTFYAPITGVYVSATSAGSDAAKYLKEGDIITEVNGRPVTIIYDVMDIVNQYNGGDKVTVRYYRNGKYSTATVTLRTSKDIG